VTATPRLLEMVASGELDWDNPDHRAAYLRAWARGDLPREQLPPHEQADDDGRRDHDAPEHPRVTAGRHPPIMPERDRS